IQSCGLRAEERLGDLRMARAQGAELHPIAVVLALRQRYEPSKASVTPLQAESTMPTRAAGRESMIAATRRKQPASATLEPPNLCTTQGAGLDMDFGNRPEEKAVRLY